MKIIDLLKKIANNEKWYPYLIKYEGFVYHYDRGEDEYIYINDYDEPEGLLDNIFTFSQLNDEVEIISWEREAEEPRTYTFNFSIEEEEEDNKKIEKEIKWYFIEEKENEKMKIAQINMNFKILREKLIEIIDKLNEVQNEK